MTTDNNNSYIKIWHDGNILNLRTWKVTRSLEVASPRINYWIHLFMQTVSFSTTRTHERYFLQYILLIPQRNNRFGVWDVVYVFEYWILKRSFTSMSCIRILKRSVMSCMSVWHSKQLSYKCICVRGRDCATHSLISDWSAQFWRMGRRREY